MGEERKETVLDLTGCTGLMELHERLREAFAFPAYYGRNLDALWDMGRDYITEGQSVLVKGADTLPPELQAYFLERVLRVLRDLEKEKAGVCFLLEGEPIE